MAYQVWTYDGEPYLIWNERDLPEQYTVIPPEDGMYYPIRFDEDENKWIGSEPSESPSEPEEPKEPPTTPDQNLIMIAQLNMTVAKQSNLIKDQEKLIKAQNQQIADSYMALAKQNKKKESDIDGNE